MFPVLILRNKSFFFWTQKNQIRFHWCAFEYLCSKRCLKFVARAIFLLIKNFNMFTKRYLLNFWHIFLHFFLTDTINAWVVTIICFPFGHLFWNVKHFRENSADLSANYQYWCKISSKYKYNWSQLLFSYIEFIINKPKLLVSLDPSGSQSNLTSI